MSDFHLPHFPEIPGFHLNPWNRIPDNPLEPLPQPCTDIRRRNHWSEISFHIQSSRYHPNSDTRQASLQLPLPKYFPHLPDGIDVIAQWLVFLHTVRHSRSFFPPDPFLSSDNWSVFPDRWSASPADSPDIHKMRPEALRLRQASEPVLPHRMCMDFHPHPGPAYLSMYIPTDFQQISALLETGL